MKRWLWVGLVLVLLLVFVLVEMSTRQPVARITAVQQAQLELLKTTGQLARVFQ